MSSQLEDAFNEAVEQRVRMLRAALAAADRYARVHREHGYGPEGQEARAALKATLAFASPDERLREALAFYADKGNYTAQNPVGSGAHVWRDMGGRARAALAAADREKPDEKVRAMTLPDGEAYCPPVSDDPVNDPETNT